MATRTDYPIVSTDHPTCSNWWQPDYPAFLFSHLRWIKKVFFSSEAEPVSTQQEAQLINTPRSLRVETVSVFFFFFLFLLFLYFSSLLRMSSSNSAYEETNKYQIEKSHHEDRVSEDFEKSLHEVQIEHVPEGTAGPGKALFMLLKAFVGTGVIFLPAS